MKQVKRGDNRGFSLVELMIGITILGLVAAPLLHIFVTSAGTANRSERLGGATLAAQNLAEAVEAASLSALQTNPRSALGGTGAGFYTYDGSEYRLDLNPQRDRADCYYIGVSGVDNPAGLPLNAMVTLKADGAYAAMNDQEVTSHSPMDAVLAQTRQTGDDPDHIAEAAFASEANVVSNGSYVQNKKSRSIILDVALSDGGATLSATVTYQYEYTYAYDREEYDDFGNVTLVHVANAKFRDSVIYTLFPKGHKMSDGAPTVYLLYYPWYVAGSPEEITVNNRDNVPFPLFLVKQWDPAYAAADLQAKESTYAAAISLHQTCGAEEGAVLCTNAARNLVTGQDNIGGVSYHIYRGNYLYENGTLSGDLVQRLPENRIYEVTVDLYEGNYTGTPLYTLHTTKLQ